MAIDQKKTEELTARFKEYFRTYFEHLKQSSIEIPVNEKDFLDNISIQVNISEAGTSFTAFKQSVPNVSYKPIFSQNLFAGTETTQQTDTYNITARISPPFDSPRNNELLSDILIKNFNAQKKHLGAGAYHISISEGEVDADYEKEINRINSVIERKEFIPHDPSIKEKVDHDRNYCHFLKNGGGQMLKDFKTALDKYSLDLERFYNKKGEQTEAYKNLKPNLNTAARILEDLRAGNNDIDSLAPRKKDVDGVINLVMENFPDSKVKLIAEDLSKLINNTPEQGYEISGDGRWNHRDIINLLGPARVFRKDTGEEFHATFTFLEELANHPEKNEMSDATQKFLAGLSEKLTNIFNEFTDHKGNKIENITSNYIYNAITYKPNKLYPKIQELSDFLSQNKDQIFNADAKLYERNHKIQNTLLNTEDVLNRITKDRSYGAVERT